MLVTQVYLTLCDPRTVACQGPLTMRFSRQKYWNGLSFPSPEDLPDLGIEPGFPVLQADSSPLALQGIVIDTIKEMNWAMSCWIWELGRSSSFT